MTIKPEPTISYRGKPRSKPDANSEADARERVIDATVQSIIDLGFYRGSSTNEIVRRAGVTWGVIQHHFGNREGLMLAVLQDGARQMIETVVEARIDGATIDDRMTQLINVFATLYARPEYLATLQVQLNMDRDPRTSSEVRKTMFKVAEQSHAHVRRLLREALGSAVTRPDLVTTIFLVIKGFGLSQQLFDSMAYNSPLKRNRAALHRRLLAEILAPYIASVTTSR